MWTGRSRRRPPHDRAHHQGVDRKNPGRGHPTAVKLRIFERDGGVCHISGRKITASDKWDADHIIPLADGGEHRESNLAPAIREAHQHKTAQENAARAVTRRKRSRHIGIKKTVRNPLPGSKGSKWRKKLNGEVVPR